LSKSDAMVLIRRPSVTLDPLRRRVDLMQQFREIQALRTFNFWDGARKES
jgi:hypothetical protein